MARKHLFVTIIVMVPLLFLFYGCGASVASPTPIPPTATFTLVPPTPIPSPTPEEPVFIEVTFDGNGCTVSGPAELQKGNQSFVLNDQSDKSVDLWVSRLIDGKTFQDLLDLQSEPGEWTPKPDWVVYSGQIGAAEKIPSGGEVWTYRLNIEGEHFIYVGIYLPNLKNLWYCAPLKIIKPPSE